MNNDQRNTANNNISQDTTSEQLQKKYIQQQAELAQAKLLISKLQIEQGKLDYALNLEKVKSKSLAEQLESQQQMIEMTTNFLTNFSESEKKQRKEIELKNQELETKTQKIKEQQEISDTLYKELQKSNHKLKVQKDYLEATMNDLQKNNDEIQMQKDYLQVMVKDLEENQGALERQKSSLEVMVKALESNLEVEKQKNRLEQELQELGLAYEDITASITYAKRIQDAMLPKPSLLELYFEDYLIFFKPRDIVSGDFYWFTQEGNKIIFVAADCTGHGVPGALMSMLGINLLSEIVSNKKNTSPEKILNLLDMGINYILDQKKTKNNDGMDIAICTIDLETKTLEYAGAHNPLLIIQDNEPTVVTADRLGVGGYDSRKKSVFKKHSILIEKPTTIYIYSDGYQDQFGGNEKRKFMSKNFRKLLTKIHQKPMQEQKKILNTTLEEWQDGQTQVDDILILGLQIS